MAEIERLSHSKDKAERLKSLDLFAETYPRLPASEAKNYVERMVSDEDSVVAEKAKDVLDNIVKPYEEKTSRKWMAMSSSLLPSISASIERMQSMSGLFDRSQQVARILHSAFSSHVQMDVVKKALDAFRIVDPIVVSGWGLHENAAFVPSVPSPIVNALRYETIIAEKDATTEPIEEAFAEEADELRLNLDTILSSQGDPSFNYEGYELLFKLESVLRLIITEKIVKPNEKTLSNVLPKGLLQSCESLLEEESDSRVVIHSGNWMDYTDFADLERIIQTGRNIKRLGELADEQHCMSVVTKLHELDHIRKKIAHSRILTKSEFDRLRMYATDIITLFTGCVP